MNRQAALFEPSRRPDSDCAAAPLRHRDASAQKLLLVWTVLVKPHVAQIKKVFLVLFVHKKNCFLCLLQPKEITLQ
jgi:hypothetical protein